MIIGDLENWEKEKVGFSPLLQKAVEYIRDTDLIHLEVGTYEIDGENMFAVVQEIKTVRKSDRMAECHSKYIDVQYLISGEEEIIYVARQSEQQVIVQNELVIKDYALYEEVQCEFEIVLKPGMFAIFFPSDLHRPGCSKNGQSKIKKVVIKVDRALLC